MVAPSRLREGAASVFDRESAEIAPIFFTPHQLFAQSLLNNSSPPHLLRLDFLSSNSPQSAMPFRMYIDECGTDDVVSCHLDPHRHLALTGVIISHDDCTNYANPRMAALKETHFPQADPDASPIVLHRSDFLGGSGPFQAMQNEEKLQAFCDDLHSYLDGLNHSVITVVIDKFAMLKKDHWALKEPYHYCAEVLAEKFVQFLERENAVGDVWAESRKIKKNKALQRHFSDACNEGTRYVGDPARFAARLTSFDIQFREKKHNCTGLQIADVYAKPSMDQILRQRIQGHAASPFSMRFGQLLQEKKYDRSPTGRVKGYGMKFMP